MPEALNSVVALTRDGINAKTVTTTVIDVTENGTRRFMPYRYLFEATAATAITIGPTVQIGVASPYNDMLPSTALGIKAANDCDYNPAPATVTVAANTNITLSVTAGATGTSMTMRATIFGYYY